jgi:hypothetical protein
MSVKSEARDFQINTINKYAKSCEDSTSKLSDLLSLSGGSSSDLLKIRNGLRGLVKESKARRKSLKDADSVLSSLKMNFRITKTHKHEDELFDNLELYGKSVVTALENRIDGYKDSGGYKEWYNSTVDIDLSEHFDDTYLRVYGNRAGAPVDYNEMLDAMIDSGIASYKISSDDDSAEAADDASSAATDDTVDDEADTSDGDDGETSSGAVAETADASTSTILKVICILITEGSIICGPLADLIGGAIDKAAGSNKCKGKKAACRCACDAIICGGAGDGEEAIMGMDPEEECELEKDLCYDNCDNPDG